jgi:hypothetical protein
VPELPGTRYRELIYGAHRVVFALEQNVVKILTIRRYKQRLSVSEIDGAG